MSPKHQINACRQEIRQPSCTKCGLSTLCSRTISQLKWHHQQRTIYQFILSILFVPNKCPSKKCLQMCLKIHFFHPLLAWLNWEGNLQQYLSRRHQRGKKVVIVREGSHGVLFMVGGFPLSSLDDETPKTANTRNTTTIVTHHICTIGLPNQTDVLKWFRCAPKQEWHQVVIKSATNR